MASSHMKVRGAGYDKTKANFPAIYAGVVGDTGFRGTAALPSFSWEEDPDTGLFSQAANTASITAGGTEIARINSSGINVQSGSLLGDLGGTDKEVFIAASNCQTIYLTTGTWTNTRVAQGDYRWRKTAGAETTTIEIPLNCVLTASAASKGFQLNSVDFIFAVGTTDLTSITYDLIETTYTAGSAASVSTTVGGTLTGTTGTVTAAAVVRVDTVGLGTPYYMVGNKLTLFSAVAVCAAGSVLDVIGVVAKGKFTA